MSQQDATCSIMHQYFQNCFSLEHLATLSAVLRPVWNFFHPSQRNTCLVKKCPVHKQRVVGLGKLTGKEGKETANL